MRLTQKKILLNVLEETDDWMPGHELIRRNTPWGCLGSEADRRLRELAQEGKIERRMVDGYVEYRAIPRLGFKLPEDRFTDGQLVPEDWGKIRTPYGGEI